MNRIPVKHRAATTLAVLIAGIVLSSLLDGVGLDIIATPVHVLAAYWVGFSDHYRDTWNRDYSRENPK